ncbi:hypothetical protein HMPREF2902_05980 [Actinomyces sp. HMSC035G02]|nr:hypothetical protein HMPREF2902_05980 [Actinomyces sp. HMSC035G02]
MGQLTLRDQSSLVPQFLIRVLARSNLTTVVGVMGLRSLRFSLRVTTGLLRKPLYIVIRLLAETPSQIRLARM